MEPVPSDGYPKDSWAMMQHTLTEVTNLDASSRTGVTKTCLSEQLLQQVLPWTRPKLPKVISDQLSDTFVTAPTVFNLITNAACQVAMEGVLIASINRGLNTGGPVVIHPTKSTQGYTRCTLDHTVVLTKQSESVWLVTSLIWPASPSFLPTEIIAGGNLL